MLSESRSKEVQEMRECEARFWLNKCSRDCLEHETRGFDPRIAQRKFLRSLRETLARTRGEESAKKMLDLLTEQYFKNPERYPVLWHEVMRNIQLSIAA